MKKMPLILTIAITIALSINSCNPQDVLGDESDNSENSDKIEKQEAETDYELNDSDVTSITLKGTSIVASSNDVHINGNTATIIAGGSYFISGTLNDGQIIVNAPKEVVKIVLNGAIITSSTTSPFFIEKATKTIIFLNEGTTNTLSDPHSYVNSDKPNACIYSKSYLAITGQGSLNVLGNYQDGIASADELIINSGTITVSAIDDAIRGKDYLKINDGIIKATSNSGHALKSNNDENSNLGYVQIDGGVITLASSTGKGIKAVTKYVQNGGTITITKSNEGIESQNIIINDGYIDITATDDALNATKKTNSGERSDGSVISINGGTVLVSSTRGDAIDSNGTLTINGGLVIANGPSSGVEQAVDTNGAMYINGGILIAAGAKSRMDKIFDGSSKQSNIYLTFSSSITSSTMVNIEIDGMDVITFRPKNSATGFYFSCPDMQKGSSYSIYTGGSYSLETNLSGYFTGGIYSQGTVRRSGTLSGSSTANSISI